MAPADQKTAFVTGYTGQDGTFITDLLLSKGYRVIALVRRVSTEPPHRVRGRFDFSRNIADGSLVLEMGDLLSIDSLIRIISRYRPDEVYNLAAQSDVHVSFMQPEYSVESTLMGVINLITALEAVEKASKGQYKWRMYQASTSEMFGDRPAGAELTEKSRLHPNSPYAISKAAAHWYCQYKRKNGAFISCGILFNHESEIRGGNFVTQKIVREAVRINTELDDLQDIKPMQLGNLDSVRDWGYAGDYVKAMVAMLQVDEPNDFVIGTGKTHTVKEFVEAVFAALNHQITWKGASKGTKGYVDGELAVVVSDKFWRPVDVTYLKAKTDRAKKVLKWQPETSFESLVTKMVEAEIDRHTGTKVA